MQRARVYHVQTAIVTVHQDRRGSLGESAKSVGGAVEVATFILGGDLFVLHTGFDGPSAARPPIACHHVLDHGVLEDVDGLQPVDVFGQDRVEGLQTFAFEDQAPAFRRDQSQAPFIARPWPHPEVR